MSRRVLRLLLGSLAALLLASLLVAPIGDRRATPGTGWLTGPVDASWLPGPLCPGTNETSHSLGADESSHGGHRRPAITNPSASTPDQHHAAGLAVPPFVPHDHSTTARADHAPAPSSRLPHSIAPRAPPALLDR